MDIHEEKVELMRKYAQDIQTDFIFYVGEDVSQKKTEISNAIKKFANDVDPDTIIGFYDTTIANNGKCGYIFTDDKVCYLETLEKPKKLWYDEINSIEVFGDDEEDYNKKIIFSYFDGTIIEWTSRFLNKTPLKDFFTEIIEIRKNSYLKGVQAFEHYELDLSGAIAGGYAVGAYGQVNKAFDEEKFHANQGHGFAAERVNNLYDKLKGNDAYIIGDNNEKNGADRIVDGVYIQSKYYQTGAGCIDACFEENGNGVFRYMNNGKPMQIEVPSDKYDAAVQAMEEKIKNGQVQGVTDPKEAKSIVREGHFTYEQAKNIAKAGTVESLTYDAVNGVVIASAAFGVTAIITLATSVWGGQDFKSSIKLATYSGLKVGGTAFATTVIAGQLSKAGLNSALVGSSEAMVAFMGPKASAVLINAFRDGSKIYGAAAMKSAAKLLRGNVITAGVTVVVLSSFDIANIFRGRISGKQFLKNLTNTTVTVGGGTAGWIGGAAVGSMILPVAGTVIGGLAGSVAAGTAAGKATDSVMDKFIKPELFTGTKNIKTTVPEASF